MSTVATTPPTQVPWTPALGRVPYRISVEQYEEMVQKGIFLEPDRIELIEGQLVERMTKNPPHSVTVGICLDAIGAAIPAGWHIRGKQSVRIPMRDSEPEPDISVVRGKRSDWLRAHPGPGAVALIVEMSDSSVEADRALATTYLGGGFPDYRIVNIRDRQLEVYSGQDCVILGESESVDPVIDGHPVSRIAVADLLPSRP